MAGERGGSEFRSLVIGGAIMAVMGLLVMVVAAVSVGTGADITASGTGVLGLILLLIGGLLALAAYVGGKGGDQ